MEGSRMSDNNNNQDVQVETTSVFRADLLKEMESGAAAPATGSDITPPAGAAILIVKRGPNAGARFLLDQETTTAGRHPESDIFLDDVTVSRRHAEFRLNDGTFEVVDVGSLNGTYVNREPRNSQVLSIGDEIQIGKFRLVFIAGPEN
ncbi:oxoglutarate dehydrogenase inhibitor [Corynebacterium matruchotii ATCC 33806]|jgi:oxoglutarate dehydrogenase inhibitor|uniref:Oxoglutarate dehydrogenase inhibitor n=2 Tax=Corynebacterium matruchotii TaxID=43768 RepID=C0E3G0_9CORY|nr:oxoglutarate dehydrogenase inhibitor [Corynebacterium matruchotii ATCC 33806]